MELNLVELVRRSRDLTHAELHLYLCYAAFRDPKTGIARPSNLSIHTYTGIGYRYISKVKGRLAAKSWIDLLGGRRVRPLVGFEAKNSSEGYFSEKEGKRAPTDSPVKNSLEGKNSSEGNFSEGQADAENSLRGNFSDPKNSLEGKNSSEGYFPPTPPYKDKNIFRNTASEHARVRAGSGGTSDVLDFFQERYGRTPDELCDREFIQMMKEHPEFRGVDAEKVWIDMRERAKRPKTCYRFWKWLEREKSKQEEGEALNGADRKQAGRDERADRAKPRAAATRESGAESSYEFRPRRKG